MQPVSQEQYRNIVNRIINNGGFNLDRPGNEGRYTRSHYIQNPDEWDSIFEHFIGYSHALYDTSEFIYHHDFGGRARAHRSWSWARAAGGSPGCARRRPGCARRRPGCARGRRRPPRGGGQTFCPPAQVRQESCPLEAPGAASFLPT